MKLTLDFHQRLTLSAILPAEGGFTDMLVKKDLQSKIAVELEEATEVELKTVWQWLSWNSEKVKWKTYDYEITEVEKQLIQTQLEALDKAKKLSDSHVALYQLIKK